jgi:hypothetical protein
MTTSRLRRLSALVIVAVIVWGVVLFIHGVHLVAHHHDKSSGVIGTLVVLPVLVTVCAWIALGLWRDRSG